MSTARPRSGKSNSGLPNQNLKNRACKQSAMHQSLSIDEGKENTTNKSTRSSELQAKTPFQDITNVVGCRKLSEGKRDCLQTSNSATNLVQSVGHSINPTDVCGETITSSEIKRYHNRDRYWRMTPEQREAYLQRNREYKRRIKNNGTNSDIVQSAMGQTTATHISKGIKVAVDSDLSMPSSGMINPTVGSQVLRNPSGISTSNNIPLYKGQQECRATYLESFNQHKIRRLADGPTSCSNSAQYKYLPGHASTNTGRYKRKASYMEMSGDYNRGSRSNGVISNSISALDDRYTSSKYKRGRLSGEPCCSTTRDTYECSSSLLKQPGPAVGSLNVSTSDKILRENIVSPVSGSRFMINPCDMSNSCDNLTNTGQNKRMSTFLDRCSEYKRIRMSNAAGCSTTAEETHDYVCASASIDQCKWTNTDMDMMSNCIRKRSSDEASCSFMGKDNGNLHDQCIPLKMQECAAVQEHLI